MAQVATRIAIMRAGQFLEVVPADQVLYQPTNDYTRELLSAVPELPIALTILLPISLFLLPALNFQLLAVNFCSSALESLH